MRTVLLLLAAGAFAADAMAQSAPTGAFHRPFGAGCYEQARESFHVWFGDAASASAALSGRRLTLLPTANGYSIVWGAGGYRAPSATAAVLPPSDDGQTAVNLPQPLPTPFGNTSVLWVHSNGIVACGPGIDGGSWNTPPNDFTPGPAFRHAPDTAFFAWHDWNPAEPGSGRIRTEVVPIAGENVLCVTWLDVENFPAGVSNRGTFQFQFGLATGRVDYVWSWIDPDTSSPFGSSHLVGFSPGGPSLDRPALAVGAAAVTAPDLWPLALAASPPPVSTPASGTLVSYSLAAVPSVGPGNDVRLGFLALGFTATEGIDLAAVGAPGCSLLLGAFDITYLVGGTTPSLGVAVPFPAGLPAGLEVHAQALALAQPAVVGSWVNTLGIVTSNGLTSHVDAH